MRTRDAVLVLLVATAVQSGGPASAQPRETAGVITEIKVASGKAEIRAAGGPWRPVAPLQALRAGDEVRTSDGASVVVLLSGGRGVAKVDAKNSPYVVGSVVADEGKVDKARTLVAGSVKFLTAGPKEPPKAVLATRSMARPPEVLTPRNGPVLPGPLAFEWLGNQVSRYTVRIVGPSDVIVERKGVVGARFEYPADAPPLQPGVGYRVEVIAPNQPPQGATFEIVDLARARAVQADLGALESALGAGTSPSSIAVARAGYLAEIGLLHDARLAVLAALARDPDQPVLHTLLGTLYTQTGLPRQAAAAFDEAQSLMTRGTPRP
ncbi:MAG TPA: hypothetical protein VK548_11580 [Candidatus Acidoferrum sp.]|nr:hypothetical protein [Candidatus Acidoferrum sp.]